MNIDFLIQIASILFVLTAGPLIVIFLAARGGNL